MKYFILTIILTLFIGCGSTDTKTSESKETPTIEKPEKQTPTKSAEGIFTIGDDQHVLEGRSVRLSASMLDKTKEFTKYSWKVNGKTVSTSKEFTAADLTKGEHKFSLEATDKDGNVYKDTVTVVIKKETESNNLPIAKSLKFELKEDEQFSGSLGGSDADGDELSYIFVSFPKHGKLRGSSANLRYKPDADYNGKDSFVYKTNDGIIDSEYATVSIEIEAVNDAPVVDDQSITLDEDSFKDIILTGTDVDGDDLNFTVVIPPTKGKLEGRKYTPILNYNGNDSFTFLANDGKVDSKPAIISILVNSKNDKPIFRIDNLTIDANEDDSVKTGMIEADDIDEEIVTFKTVNKHGFILNENGSYTFDPAHLSFQSLKKAEEKDFIISIEIDDNVSQNMTISMTGVNDAPEFKSSALKTINEGESYSYDINVSDIDEDLVSLTMAQHPWLTLHGTVLSGTPQQDNVGKSSITITADDGTTQKTQEFNLTVNNINNPPQFDSTPITKAIEGIEYEYFILVSDLDNNVEPTKVLKKPEWLTFDLNRLYGTPTQSDINIDNSIQLQISDGEYTKDQNFTIAISDTNYKPKFTKEAISIVIDEDNDTIIQGNFSAKDDDNDTLRFSKNDDFVGFILDENGSYSFTPEIDSYQHLKQDENITKIILITVTDTAGETDEQNLTIIIHGENDAPIANNDDISVWGATTINVLDNDTDADNNKSTLTITEINSDTLQNGNNAKISDDKKYIDYTPATDFSGTDTFTYYAYDGIDTSIEANVTVTVKRPFIMTIDINESDSNFTIPIDSTRNDYNYSIACNGTDNYEKTTTCTYATTGEYNISIIGDFPHIKFKESTLINSNKLLHIQQWGDIKWKSMKDAFYNCKNMTLSATDSPDLTTVTDMSHMFYQAEDFNGSLKDWDVSNVKNMSNMFNGANGFDSNISDWNVSKVENMSYMFKGASTFNHDISSWDVSNVTTMSAMFWKATNINQNLNNWDVSNVEYMNGMFAYTNFNSDISDWNVSQVTTMMNFVVHNSSFNQDISNWKFSSLRSTQQMFLQASSFNQDISKWNVSTVTTMTDMFTGAGSFDKNLGDWNISNVSTMGNYMFVNSGLSNENYTRTLEGWLDSGVQDGITLGASNLFRTSTDAYDTLRNNHSWTINDKGLDPAVINEIAFITTWETTANDNNITIPTRSGFTYDYTVIWGDGEQNASVTGDISHTYNTEGNHTVKIYGLFPGIQNSKNLTNAQQLCSVNQWGTQEWKTMLSAFQYCANLEINATDKPDLSQVTSLQSMFNNAINFDSNISDWDVSTITNMSQMFYSAKKFNQDISGWDVSNVTTMYYMFKNAHAFNQNISPWDVSSVTKMADMFRDAKVFNQDLANWNISSVTSMTTIFNDSNLSNENYTLTLEGWLQNGVSNNVIFGAGDKRVTRPEARDELIGTHLWHINDGGYNHAPVANMGMNNFTILQGRTVDFNASLSSDVDGDGIAYLWNITTSTNELFSHTFDTLGEHTVTLTVTDDNGATHTDSIIISVIIPTISFTTKTIDAGKDITWLEVADIDKDGDMDILVTMKNSFDIFWYENHGRFDNLEKHTITTSIKSKSIRIADINNDGYKDIIHADAFVEICFNNHDKTFNCNKTFEAEDIEGNIITKLEIADIDEEHGSYIVVISKKDKKVGLFNKNGNGDFDYSTLISNISIENHKAVDSVDVDGDGDIDFIIASFTDNFIKYYRNDSGTFSETTIAVDEPLSVCFANMDDSGDLDIISTNKKNNIYWHTTDDLNSTIVVDDLKAPPFALGVDMNKDGNMDIVTSAYDKHGKIVWYENTLSSFDEHIINGDIKDIIVTKAVDINNDGNIDIVAADKKGKIYIYKNDRAVSVKKLPETDGQTRNLTRNANDTVTDGTLDLIWLDDTALNSNRKTWVEAKAHCEGITLDSKQWRLPTAQELFFLTDKEQYNPTINQSEFLNTTGGNNQYDWEYWSSNLAFTDNSKAIYINFHDAHEQFRDKDNNTMKSNVRCVSGKSLTFEMIRDDNNSIVTDHKHALMWQDDEDVKINPKNNDNASSTCTDKGNGWRLPTANELYSIVDYDNSPNAINKSFKNLKIKIPVIGSNIYYWSSSTRPNSTDKYAFNFEDGTELADDPINSSNYVRCIKDIP